MNNVSLLEVTLWGAEGEKLAYVPMVVQAAPHSRTDSHTHPLVHHKHPFFRLSLSL